MDIAGLRNLQSTIGKAQSATKKLPMAGLEPARANYSPTDFKSDRFPLVFDTRESPSVCQVSVNLRLSSQRNGGVKLRWDENDKQFEPLEPR
jgi:hypothetical protein